MKKKPEKTATTARGAQSAPKATTKTARKPAPKAAQRPAPKAAVKPAAKPASNAAAKTSRGAIGASGAKRATSAASAARPARRPAKATEFKLKSEPLPGWRDAKSALEQWMLQEALRRTGGNMAAAGRLLGITKVAILHAVRRHGLESLTLGS